MATGAKTTRATIIPTMRYRAVNKALELLTGLPAGLAHELPKHGVESHCVSSSFLRKRESKPQCTTSAPDGCPLSRA